jgi:hypothetical protein
MFVNDDESALVLSIYVRHLRVLCDLRGWIVWALSEPIFLAAAAWDVNSVEYEQSN